MFLTKKSELFGRNLRYVRLILLTVFVVASTAGNVLGQSGRRGGGGSGSRGVPAGGGGGSGARGIPAGGVGGGSGARGGNFGSANNAPRIEYRQEVIRGTLVDVKKTGRSTRLAVKDQNGIEESINVNSNIKTAFLTPGTTDQLEEQQYVSVDTKRVDGRLVANEYLIYVGYNKRDLPIGVQSSGSGSRNYIATGKIVEIEKGSADASGSSLTLDVRGRKKPTIEQGEDVKVTVQNADLSQATAGSLVEIQGVRASTGAFKIQTIKVIDNNEPGTGQTSGDKLLVGGSSTK